MPVEDSSSDVEQPDENVLAVNAVNPIASPDEGPVNDEETHTEDRVGCKALPYCDGVMVVAISLSCGALFLSMAQSFFGILGIIAFFLTIVNCCFTTNRLGMISAAIIQSCLAGVYLVHASKESQKCDPSKYRYFPCNVSTLFLGCALWFVSGTLIFYFVFSGRIDEFHKDDNSHGREATNGTIEAYAFPEPVIPDESLSEEDEEDSDDDSEDSVPLTPATPVERQQQGTIAYLPNGNEDTFLR